MPAGDQNERRHEHGIEPQLRVDQQRVALDERERQQVDDAQPVGQADQEEERIDREHPRHREVQERRRPQQGGRDDDPPRDEPRDPGANGGRFGWGPIHQGAFLRLAAREVADEREDRHVHRDDDAAHDAAEERHHRRSSSVNRPATATSTSSS